MLEGPKSSVFTTVRARDGVLFHLDLHVDRLKRHAEVLGINVPEIKIPEGLDGLVRITVDSSGVSFSYLAQNVVFLCFRASQSAGSTPLRGTRTMVLLQESDQKALFVIITNPFLR